MAIAETIGTATLRIPTRYLRHGASSLPVLESGERIPHCAVRQSTEDRGLTPPHAARSVLQRDAEHPRRTAVSAVTPDATDRRIGARRITGVLGAVQMV